VVHAFGNFPVVHRLQRSGNVLCGLHELGIRHGSYSGRNLAKLNLGVMSLVSWFFALPAGWLANKFGRKRVMSFGLVFMLLAVTGIMLPEMLYG